MELFADIQPELLGFRREVPGRSETRQGQLVFRLRGGSGGRRVPERVELGFRLAAVRRDRRTAYAW